MSIYCIGINESGYLFYLHMDYIYLGVSALVPFRDFHIRLKGFSPESNINQYMDDACVAMEKEMF
jgi:hypothetical protein